MKKDTPNPYFIKQADVYNSPAFKKFCSLIEHKFGFTSVSIMIDTYNDEKKQMHLHYRLMVILVRFIQ